MAANAKKNAAVKMSREDIIRAFSDLKDEVKSRYRIDHAIADLTGAQLRQTGRTFEALCPFHVEKTPSFKVNPSRGNYRCWGCGENGDVLRLIMVTQNLDFQPAIIFAADKIGIPVPDQIRSLVEGRKPAGPKKKLVRYESSKVRPAPGNLADAGIIPVPADVRRPAAKRDFQLWNNRGTYGDRDPAVKRYFPQMVHEYRNADGDLLMCILRVMGRDKKFFIPARLMVPTEDCPERLLENATHDGKRLAWVSIGPKVGSARPVYGMEDVRGWNAAGGKNVLIVEGEKTRDAAARMLRQADPEGKWLVLTPMGGSKSAIYADWGPFFDVVGDRKINIIQWPDADKPLQRPDGTVEDRLKQAVDQMQSVIAQRALDRGVLDNIVLGQVRPPKDVKSGWDVADAEEEGWAPHELINFIKKNSMRTNMANLELRKTETPKDMDASGLEEPEMAAPFELAGEPAAQDDDIDWLEMIDETLDDGSDGTETAPMLDAPEIEDVASEDLISPDEVDQHQEIEEENAGNRAFNSHFRCLGYLDTVNVFMSLTSGQVFELAPKQMNSTSLLHLAPLDWWEENFPKLNRNGQPAGPDWQRAVDFLIQATYSAGVWDPRLRCSQGARLDGGTVVFHTGSQLYVDGEGSKPLHEFTGQYVYTVGPRTRMPDVVTPFTADSPEVRQLLDIICKLDWHHDRRELSIMALMGWIAIAPICGMLPWRSHIWLDGPRGSGKSWVTRNIVGKVLGDFAVSVVSNSSESGIRNFLVNRSVPVIFDEAEGEDMKDRKRMDDIIKMARYSSTEDDAVVAQGVSGGGAARGYKVASTFMLTSIVPGLEKSADQSRFARLKLSSGRKHDGFKNDIEIPALDLITKEFSDRWIGRILTRAKDYMATYRHMVHALSCLGLERRLADVFGSFATGCWLMMREGTPENEQEAVSFIATEFNVIEQLTDFSDVVSEDKDHTRLFAALQSHEVRLDGQNNAGARSELLGTILESACGYEGNDDAMLNGEEARKVLLRYGIRPGVGDKPAQDGEVATTVLIHKNSQAIRSILEKTPYAHSYQDVMHQADDVKMGKTVRFGSGMPPSRSIIVPLKHFSIGVDNG